MTAYVIVDIELTDAEGCEEYKKFASPAVALFA